MILLRLAGFSFQLKITENHNIIKLLGFQKKCLKLRYSIDFIKLETQGKFPIYYAGFWHPAHQKCTVHKRDGAKRPLNFRHFRHFGVYPG
jgi:hypothetical protein